MFCPLLSLLLLLFVIPPVTSTPYNAVDLILLNCGGPSSDDFTGRRWDADDHSKYMPENSNNISAVFSASRMDNSLPGSIPYQTARIFYSPFTYSFPVSTMGHKFIRLYFYPDTYAGFDTSQSLFSLTANDITLLGNFSAFLNSPNLSEPSLSKEFVIYAIRDQGINLTFSPNPNSFAFINGIEIVSIPDDLYFEREGIMKYAAALETLYRLNVGGANVQRQYDTGMFRYWSQDDAYIFGSDNGLSFYNNHSIEYTLRTPPYSAPTIVYQTYRTMSYMSMSLEWIFPVDSGFHYLFRFHFCDDADFITGINERAFTISIGSQTAWNQLDVISSARRPGIPMFQDYVIFVRYDGSRGKTDLRLSLIPDRPSKPVYYSALLNGLEIFKMSDSKGSLAAANPEVIQPLPLPSAEKKNRTSFILYIGVGCVVGFLVVVEAGISLYSRHRMKVNKPVVAREQNIEVRSPLPSHLCRYFFLEEIITATHNFDDGLVIGKGGFGNVYKGFINGGMTMVAVKRLHSSSNQGTREFLTEIKLLSKLSHLHLVSLIGYCNENREMILVYDYMARGTLRSHICNSDHPPLSWKQRLQICLGAAKGLDYLHNGTNRAIIHRDIKSTNILLDQNLEAKVSDFGLSKIGPTDHNNMCISTAVKGSFGYIDPEYYRRKKLTDKSDVFSFGVVLFEVLCNRPAVLADLPRKEANLAEWAKSCYREGTIEQIIDPIIKAEIAPECMYKFLETAIRCVRMEGSKRPTMIDVVWSLEFALKLQMAAEEDSGRGSGGSFGDPIPTFRLTGNRDPEATGEMLPGSTEESVATSTDSGLQAREDFSELVNPRGR